MDIERRAQYWSDWESRLSILARDVWDALTEDFAPLRYRCGQRVEADKDTAAVEKLYDALEMLKEQVELSERRAACELSRMYESAVMYRAWESGKCPVTKKEVSGRHVLITRAAGLSPVNGDVQGQAETLRAITKE